ncbi:MAG TPA: hypothetical protein VFG23_17380 [Polyangia bacterium]|nr:hypothetical protein [Polyangia bacterium]
MGWGRTRGLLLVALLLAVPSCQTACGLVGCAQGLSITFDANFNQAATYDVVVSVVTATPETVPIATCTLVASDGGGAQLLCGSQEAHSEQSNTLRIEDTTLAKVLVSVSLGGNTVAEQTFEPAYTTAEINGPGCGTCTSASIQMTIP